MYTCKVDKSQATIKLAMNDFFLLPSNSVPLVYNDYHRASCVQDMAQQMQVLIIQTFLRIDHQNDNVSICDCFQRLDD